MEQPDNTGFCGITSSALVMGTCDPRRFSAGGYAVNVTREGQRELETQDSDVVRFVSREANEHAGAWRVARGRRLLG